MLNVHARKTDERVEVVFDQHGAPIGPNGKIVSEFSHFLGTVGRNSYLCPLIYTNFKAMVKADKDDNI